MTTFAVTNNTMKLIWQVSAIASLVLVGDVPRSTIAAAEPSPAPSRTLSPPSAHDGQHDFDFVIGTWKSHVRRLQKPLTGSTSWIDGEASVSVRKIWGGRGNLEEIELTTPAGHLE